jgi:hypothetical protein
VLVPVQKSYAVIHAAAETPFGLLGRPTQNLHGGRLATGRYKHCEEIHQNESSDVRKQGVTHDPDQYSQEFRRQQLHWERLYDEEGPGKDVGIVNTNKASRFGLLSKASEHVRFNQILHSCIGTGLCYQCSWPRGPVGRAC